MFSSAKVLTCRIWSSRETFKLNYNSKLLSLGKNDYVADTKILANFCLRWKANECKSNYL